MFFDRVVDLGEVSVLEFHKFLDAKKFQVMIFCVMTS
jgi:hypothetical protein